jgi:phytoene dehydrogenase-like protein
VRTTVYEATNQAGGRCRSYHDPALGITIDNGNHLLLSGNRAALGYLETIGGRDCLAGPASASFPFVDLATKERWTLRANDGRIPWWIFDRNRRVPGTRARDYLSILRLLRAAPGATIGEAIDCKGPLYDRLIGPLLLAALNTEPPASSASLAAAVIRETLAAGGRSYRPLFARDGLSAAFVEPALRFIETNGGKVVFGERLRALTCDADRATGLDFGDLSVPLRPGDVVVVEVPPMVATSLIPDLTVPTEFRAIVNAHFRLAPPVGLAPMTGIINGRMAVRLSRPSFRHHQQRRPAARYAARGTRGLDLAGSGRDRGHCRPPAPVANRAGAAGHFRRIAARGRQTSGTAYPLE